MDNRSTFLVAAAATVAMLSLGGDGWAAPTASALDGVVINEILPDPNGATESFDTDGDGTAEDSDEFVELYNQGAGAVDIGGWQLWDEGQDLYFTFPASTTLEPGAYAVVVMDVTDGALPAVSGDNLAFDAGRGASGTMNNGGDNVILLNPNTNEYVQLTYNGDGADDPTAGSYDSFPGAATLVGSAEDWGSDTDGISLTRDPAGDTNVVTHEAATGSAGNASPGGAVDAAADVEDWDVY